MAKGRDLGFNTASEMHVRAPMNGMVNAAAMQPVQKLPS